MTFLFDSQCTNISDACVQKRGGQGITTPPSLGGGRGVELQIVEMCCRGDGQPGMILGFSMN